jgi:hypothetical protein
MRFTLKSIAIALVLLGLTDATNLGRQCEALTPMMRVKDVITPEYRVDVRKTNGRNDIFH